MLRCDAFSIIEICDRSCNAQHPVVRASGQIHSAHRQLERARAAFIERANQAKLRGRYLRIVIAALALYRARLLHACANLRRCLAVGLAAQFFIWNSRYFNM